MKLPSVPKALAIATLLVLFAASCGGEADTEAGNTPTAEVATPAGASDGGDVETDVTEAGEGEVSEAETTDGEVSVGAGESRDDVDNPWVVSVLHVNDDVQIVPAFDSPAGINVTIYDVNVIDGIELEYPLLATTHFDNRLALLVQEFDATGEWAKVHVPVRPNGTTTWVQTALFAVEQHDYHITVDISENLVQLFKGDDPVPIVSQLAVVGSDALPTPLGRTYIDEKIPGAVFGPAYGSWVLSLAAFSESLGTTDGGGLPKMALQGTDQPELIGESISSGSIRLPNEIIALIAETVPVGTVVEIVA